MPSMKAAASHPRTPTAIRSSTINPFPAIPKQVPVRFASIAKPDSFGKLVESKGTIFTHGLTGGLISRDGFGIMSSVEEAVAGETDGCAAL